MSLLKPRVPTVVSSKGIPSSTEQVPFEIISPPAHLDEPTQRFLTQIQNNAAQATIAARSSPTLLSTTLTQQTLISGKQVQLRHGLGKPFTAYHSTRAYSGSSGAFAAVEVDNNGGQDPTVWLVLMPSVTGIYDIQISAG